MVEGLMGLRAVAAAETTVPDDVRAMILDRVRTQEVMLQECSEVARAAHGCFEGSWMLRFVIDHDGSTTGVAYRPSQADLGGRVEVSWTVDGGRVEGLYITSNTTGDRELAECLEKKIRRWRFPVETQGEVTWPFDVVSKAPHVP